MELREEYHLLPSYVSWHLFSGNVYLRVIQDRVKATP